MNSSKFPKCFAFKNFENIKPLIMWERTEGFLYPSLIVYGDTFALKYISDDVR
jgi:hypothetical protein